MKKVGRKSIINFSVTTGKYSSFIDEITELARNRVSSAVYFANVHMYIEAYKNESFRELINKADIVTPDGQPLAWALRLLYGIKQDRVAAMDFVPDMLQRMQQEKLPVYFYGGTQEMLDKTAAYVKQAYPGLIVAGMYSPPFRPLTAIEENEIAAQINATSPTIIFVFLGCPKQEKWMATMKGKVNAVMTGVGGALPVTIGMQKRAPVWMRNFGLEWLFRFFQEPRRLFKRYATTNSLFIWVMVKEFFRVRLLVPLKLSKA
ncbi:MAG: WecB/TagA/CpsF family glycosyltransferase [Ferruginibacter sp.]|nr:WecB/TagA/CpsF family glycosyltransferase [Ferruginibacter sp.]